MSKVQIIVLSVGLGLIMLAAVIIPSVSLIKYQVYRSQFKNAGAEARVEYVLPE